MAIQEPFRQVGRRVGNLRNIFEPLHSFFSPLSVYLPSLLYLGLPLCDRSMMYQHYNTHYHYIRVKFVKRPSRVGRLWVSVNMYMEVVSDQVLQEGSEVN